MSRSAIIRSLIVALFFFAVCAVFTYASMLYTTLQLRIASSKGAFPSAVEGMRDLASRTSPGEEDIQILYAGPNSRDGSYPYVWYVIAEVRFQPAPGGPVVCSGPGSFFLQTKQGWVHVPEGAFPGMVGIWMKVFDLAGEGQTEPAVPWAPDQPRRFCQTS